jgi:iron-sulfur cluster assembly protein
MITLTEAAAAKIGQHLEKTARSGDALRLKVAGGGCSGLRYELMLDGQVGESDEEFRQRGVRLVVDEKSALYLIGVTLDYADDLNESGFKIINPNAASTCGCGESFSA